MIVPDSASALGGVMVGSPRVSVPLNGTSHLPSVLLPSKRLAEAVDRKLQGLNEEQRALLEVVAYGEPLGRVELEAVTRPSVARELECGGLVARSDDGRRFELRLADPSHRDALRAGIPPRRQKLIARMLAEALEATGAQRQGDALRIASWRLACGGGRPEIMLAGAVTAFKRYDYPLAERLARASQEARPNFNAALLAARLAGLQGRTDEAERELAALAANADDDTQRGLVALARIDNSVTWTGSDPDGVLAQALTTISDPRWRDELEARRLGLLLYSHGPRAAAEATAHLLQRDEGAFDFARIAGAYSLGRLGQIDAAVDVTARGHTARATERSPLGESGWRYMVVHCLALNYAGRLDEGDALATGYYRAALAERATDAQAFFALVPATAVGERGRLQTAIRQTREALALSDQLGRPLMTRLCHLYGALALALGGRAHEAADDLAAIDTLDLPELLHDHVSLIQTRAWTAAAAGRLPEAQRSFEEAARLGEDTGDLVGAAAALHGLARLGQAKHVLQHLKKVAGHIEGDLAPARIDHTEALAGQDAAGLEKVSRSFEAMGADLLAAEASADASVARRHAGEQRQADAAQRRAELLADRCEGARTPALRAIDVRGRLTPAQWETVLIAATGGTSKQIADELCVSPRTVENRLQQAYEQLGISSRAELAGMLDLHTAPAGTVQGATWQRSS